MQHYNLIDLIKSDLKRLDFFKEREINIFFIILGFFGSKSAQASILFRIAHCLGKKSNALGVIITNYSIRTTGCEIRHRAKIGKGLKIVHTVGVIISDDVLIGENFTIYQGVTIGKKNKNTRNVIGNNVSVHASSVVIAEKIGDNSIIGAGSIVLKDVSDNCMVAGVPAKTIKSIK